MCRAHGSTFQEYRARSCETSLFVCQEGCRFPLVNGIPRFTDHSKYVSAFGVQWNKFRRTQLDSFTGKPISRDRLTRLIGCSLDVLRGRTVLEAGCGAGRFTEILLDAGARVVAVDMSSAVEANRANCGGYKNHLVCQGDMLALPFAPDQFDIVMCIGVVQHTPEPERTIQALCSHVKPGGLLAIDHYGYGYPMTRLRRVLRACLLRMPVWFGYSFSIVLVSGLWPIHRLSWALRALPGFAAVHRHLERVSPVVDHHAVYGELGPRLVRQWALLDTHDLLTDVYKHFRSPAEIARCLEACGMSQIESWSGGNGVEARARKPERAG